ncbi:hypothetical protein [Variovorax sp. 38R]|uniref:hypothetical protein n=1 Tax=Variovorax sp. 38R TaxID=2774875 RepID=UPI00177B43AD|nr:hypothetical protein [Variovorax sp. 38R]QOF76068.1 hypothetical protein IG196_16790 [Variovorax sp. 38R]
MASKPVSLGTFLGVNNRREAARLQVRLPGNVQATYLRAAENVDVDGGFMRRRRGISAALTPRAHSIWGDGADDGYAVVDGALVRLALDGDELQQQALLAGFTSAPVSFERMPTGAVVWSDGQRLGAIRNGAPGELVPEAPNPVPVVNVVAGALPAGRYLLAFTRVTSAGESAATQPAQLDLADGSGFVITGMDAATQVYMSGPNGDILTAVAGDTILSLTNTGPRCETLLLERMPAGQIVRHYNSSLLVARGNMLCRSEPYRYGLWRPGKSFILFPAPITVMEPCVGGVFVCADRTYWLAGDLDATAMQPVLPYGGVAGSGTRCGTDDNVRVFWVSPHGLVMGTPDGAAKAVQEKDLTFSGAARAATLYREGQGIAQAIFTRQGIRPLATASRGFVASEIHRKETVL